MQYPNRRTVNVAMGLLLAGLGSAQPAAARGVVEDIGSYPSRPITMVVGYPPGGATDIIARLVAIKLSQAWGKPVIVENKAGAGSNLATEQVVRADPDGGASGALVMAAAQSGARGLVVQAVASGHVNAAMYEAITQLLVHDVPVVIATRIPRGGTRAGYGFAGSSQLLVDAGAVLSDDLSAWKARIVLMLALQHGPVTAPALAQLFAR